MGYVLKYLVHIYKSIYICTDTQETFLNNTYYILKKCTASF